MLPGCRFATVALPLDYPPSRRPGPRYGRTHPPIPSLMSWFETRIENYRQFLREARKLPIGHIARHINDTQPPHPAWVGGPINALDTFALYAMVARARPQTFVEIGSGMTTCFTRQAITDFGLSTRLISIDPQPRSAIDSICDQVVRAGLETCDLSIFDTLQPNDIVFFDGSHRSFMNSDVTVFFIDVLPRLKPGVIVHLHDIQLPWDYPDLFTDWYWNEQYLLAVYLMNAMSRIEPLAPTRFISESPTLMAELEPVPVDLGPDNGGWKSGGSMWFTHTAPPPVAR